MQGPGGPDEDRSGGFDRGGWLVQHADGDMGEIVSAWFATAEEFLLGRTTYEMLETYWSQVSDPDNVVATQLNARTKHLVSRTVTAPAWAGTTVVSGDPVAAVAALRERPGGELQVHGSAMLARSLHDARLVDEYGLIVFPTVVGAGQAVVPRRCRPTSVELVAHRVTAAGALAMTLRPPAPRLRRRSLWSRATSPSAPPDHPRGSPEMLDLARRGRVGRDTVSGTEVLQD